MSTAWNAQSFTRKKECYVFMENKRKHEMKATTNHDTITVIIIPFQKVPRISFIFPSNFPYLPKCCKQYNYRLLLLHDLYPHGYSSYASIVSPQLLKYITSLIFSSLNGTSFDKIYIVFLIIKSQ